METPATIYIALGAVAAALVAGFFSFLNLVSSKENKVSEFRQAWIDGIRSEISTYSHATQALARFLSIEDSFGPEPRWTIDTKDIYKDIIESLTKIQLRLNPQHAKDYPNSYEAKLLAKLHAARLLLNDGKLAEAAEQSAEIRDIAAPLLKEEWERVKNGEKRYQAIRDGAQATIRYGIVLLALLAIAGLVVPLIVRAS